MGWLHMWSLPPAWLAGKWTSTTHFHEREAGKPSICIPASKEVTSASVLLRETDVRFLHIHEIGTKCSITKDAKDTT